MVAGSGSRARTRCALLHRGCQEGAGRSAQANAARRAAARKASRSATSTSTILFDAVDAPRVRRRGLLSLQSELGSLRRAERTPIRVTARFFGTGCLTARDRDRRFVPARRRPSTALTRTHYCNALNAERHKRRQGEKLDLPEFDAMSRNIRSSRSHPSTRTTMAASTVLHFVASPYIAGPYAEGEYEITLPVTCSAHRRDEARLPRVLRSVSGSNPAPARPGPAPAAATRRRPQIGLAHSQPAPAAGSRR